MPLHIEYGAGNLIKCYEVCARFVRFIFKIEEERIQYYIVLVIKQHGSVKLS